MARLLSDDRGFTIIEVLASALLVVVISLGAMSTFDATSRASDNARARAIAQDLAQQDQERLRGLTVAQLNALASGPQPKTVDGRTFQVTSTAVWDGDPDPNPDCGGDPVTTDYIRTTSMVSWGDIRVRPIVNRSLIAAPSGGTGGKIIVQTQNRANLPLQGMTVSLSPSGVRTDATTSAKGCVAWDTVPAGDYTVTISRPGYVDKNGNESFSQDVTVIDNKAVALGPITFDQAATVVARFQTTIGAYTYNSPLGSLAEAITDRLTANQAGMSQPRRFGTVGDPQPSLKTWHDDAHPTSPGLFPFTGAYGVYAGDCGAEDPTTYNKPIPDTVTVAPGDVDKPVTVRLPPIDLTINANGTALNGANVYFKPTDPNCGTTPINMGVTGPDPANAARGGRLRFPGIPWGQYSVCVEYDVNPPVVIPGYGTVSGWYTFTKPVSVTTATGPGAVTMDFYTAGAVSGRC
jgi:type II secretory pathway pseudopilin PulG